LCFGFGGSDLGRGAEGVVFRVWFVVWGLGSVFEVWVVGGGWSMGGFRVCGCGYVGLGFWFLRLWCRVEGLGSRV